MNTIEEFLKQKIKESLSAKDYQPIPLMEFCERNKISRTSVWRAEKSGQLKLIRVGRKIFVPADWASKY